MSNLIDHLKSFNRKERYWLLREAVGDDAFKLSDEFRAKLQHVLDISKEIPCDAFVAMDYHLDWIAMALHRARYGVESGPIPKEEIRGGQYINTSQIDIDLLVAFGRTNTTHLILIEAKFDTRWTNSQLKDKVKRLKEILPEDQYKSGMVKPYFVLMSPEESKNLDSKDWRGWMKPGGKPAWMALPKPKGLRKLTRSDKNGKSSTDGGHIRIDPIKPTECSL